MLFYTVSCFGVASLSQMVSILDSEFGVVISKQSLNERFNSGCVDYVKAVLQDVLQEHFENLYGKELLPGFKRILIKASTKFMAPPNLEAKYKSCGGDIHSVSKSAVSIQYEHDLKSGKITDLNITSGNRNDRTDAGETKDRFEADDLIIRDLGYFSTPVLEQCAQAGAFFLSRMESSVNVYDTKGNPVSFGAVYKEMKRNGEEEREVSVFLGKETRLPVRSVFEIDNIMRRMKEQRYITLLYVKLLLIVISLKITYSLQQSLSVQKQEGKAWILSLNKTLKTALHIRDGLLKNHWMEGKKNKLCLPEIIELFICFSDEKLLDGIYLLPIKEK